MVGIVPIPLPLAHVGSVNAWLLHGKPLTLIDTGPRDDGALSALEDGLRREGLRLENVEHVLATHHHLDHVGWPRRSSAAPAPSSRCSTASPTMSRATPARPSATGRSRTR